MLDNNIVLMLLKQTYLKIEMQLTFQICRYKTICFGFLI